jgi:SAM-dependent methyltransferase
MRTDWSGSAKTYLDFLKSEDDQLRRELLDPIVLNLLEPRRKTILDLGCGEGYFTRVLKAAGATRVVGADISPDLVKRAKEQDASGEYQIYDVVSALPFSPLTFDAAVAHMVMMDVSDINAAYQNLSRLLASSGRLIVSIVNPYYAFPVGRWLPATERIGSYYYDLLYITDYFESRVVQKTLGSCVAPLN